MPRVSVIMGVYNCKNKKLLKESVSSIIRQTFTDWEFIICNDGSTDETLQYLREIEKCDGRIKVVTYSHNKGLANALNYALSKASGEYIARQDDDDVSYPERFEKEVSFLDNNHDYQIVGCIADVYDESGVWGTFPLKETPKAIDFKWNSQFLHPTVIMRREAIAKVGGYRVAWETQKAEDYDLFMRMYANGYQGYNIQEKLYKYKVTNGNSKYRKFKDYFQEAFVRARGFKAMKLGFKSVPYVFKPITIGLIPQFIFKKIKEKQYR